MKYLAITILMCCFILDINPIFGQQNEISYLDTIYLNIENNTEVTIATADYTKIKDTLLHDLHILQQLLINDVEFKHNNKAFDIIYKPDKNLTISKFSPIQKIILQDGRQSDLKVNAKCTIVGKNYTLNILLNDSDILFESGIREQIDLALSDLPVKNRLAFTYNYSVHDGNLLHKEEFDVLNGMRDYIMMSFGVGAGLIKNQPVTDISTRIGLGFSRKGILTHRFYTSANFMFMFDENNDIDQNTFLNLGYERNYSANLSKYKWFGLEFGYLINRNGDFFTGNTYRMGLNWELNRTCTVSPYLYFENGDKFYPGLRIGLLF